MKRVRLKLPSRLSPSLLLLFLAIFLEDFNAGVIQKNSKEPPTLTSVPETSFSCQGRPAGYYADTETDCQAYHMCDILESKHSFLCPSLTLFNQKFMICDHWYAVDCALAPKYYKLNEKIGQVSEKKKKNPKNNLLKTKEKKKFSSSVFKFSDKNVNTILNRPIQFSKSQPKIQNQFEPPKFSTSRFSTTTPTPSTTSTTTFTTKKSSFFSNRFTSNRPKIFDNSGSANFNLDVAQFVGRRSGKKIKFGRDKTSSFNFDNQHRFKPIKKPKKSFFDKPNFTVSPNIFTTLSPPLRDNSLNEDFFTFNSFEDKENFQIPDSFLLPPVNENDNVFEEKSIQDISSLNAFLRPPFRTPVILHGENQEMHTQLSLKNNPFSVSNSFQFRKDPKPKLPKTNFPKPRSNRKFFISSNGFTFPNESPSFSNSARRDEDEPHHHMTMTFPNTEIMRRRRPLEINPKCPRCHPAFLRPNECHPCVIIK